MTYLTPATAKDETYSFVTSRLDRFLAAFDVAVELRFQGIVNTDATGPYFVRFSMQQVLSPHRAFVSSEDGPDNRVYETSGLLFGVVNAAISSEDSFRYGDLLATEIRNIMRDANTPNGVWLRNARFNEIPNDSEYYKWNVVCEYEYDEIG